MWTCSIYLRKRFIMRNWLIWLWSLRSPSICLLQAGGPETLVLMKLMAKTNYFCTNLNSFSPSLQAWELEDLMSKCRRRWMFKCKHRKAERICPSFTFLFNSCPHHVAWCPSHWQGSSSLLNLKSKMLISFENTPKNIPRKNVLSCIWAF